MKKDIVLLLCVVILVNLNTGCKKDSINTRSTTVTPPGGGNGGGNRPPVANAGPDQTVILPKNNTVLYGSGSYDPDSNKLQYYWRLLSGPAGSFIDHASVNAVVNFLAEGQYAFELSVSDGISVSYDTVNVFVIKPGYCQVTRNEISVRFEFLSDIPFAPENSEIIAAGNKLIIPQGQVNGIPSRFINIYDLQTHTWNTTQLAEARAEMAIIAAGNKVIFAGGLRSDDGYSLSTTSRVDIYDLQTDGWATTYLSESKGACKVATAGNKLFIAGGLKSNRTFSRLVEIYDLNNNTWSLSVLPGSPRAIMSAATANNKIFFCGGYTEYMDYTGWGEVFGAPAPDIDIFDIGTGQWSVESLNDDIGEFGVMSHNNKVYLMGGYTYLSNWRLFDMQILDAATLTKTQTCLFQPNTFYSKNVAAINDQLIFIGNNSYYGAGEDKVDIYNTQTGIWSIGLLPPGMLRGGYYSALGSSAGKLYAIVGSKLYEVNF